MKFVEAFRNLHANATEETIAVNIIQIGLQMFRAYLFPFHFQIFLYLLGLYIIIFHQKCRAQLTNHTKPS